METQTTSEATGQQHENDDKDKEIIYVYPECGLNGDVNAHPRKRSIGDRYWVPDGEMNVHIYHGTYFSLVLLVRTSCS